ncbi:MAG TPA: helix-turn-helix transcriptional regulator [Oscillospiraceae bacterium]|nr:helix-turn-helix transcriptional regulator [Oscillospiraceae bacterium]
MRQLLKDYGFTQARLAKLMGLTQPQISYWINKKYLPNIKQLKQLAEIFNITVEEMIEKF